MDLLPAGTLRARSRPVACSFPEALKAERQLRPTFLTKLPGLSPCGGERGWWRALPGRPGCAVKIRRSVVNSVCPFLCLERVCTYDLLLRSHTHCKHEHASSAHHKAPSEILCKHSRTTRTGVLNARLAWRRCTTRRRMLIRCRSPTSFHIIIQRRLVHLSIHLRHNRVSLVMTPIGRELVSCIPGRALPYMDTVYPLTRRLRAGNLLRRRSDTNTRASCIRPAPRPVSSPVICQTVISPNNSQGPISLPSIPRGPPSKPKHSDWAVWVGNLPPHSSVVHLKDHFATGATKDIQSVFLITKTGCAFVNYKSETACHEAIQRFDQQQFRGNRLVCRIRRNAANGKAGSVGSAPSISEVPSLKLSSSEGSSSKEFPGRHDTPVLWQSESSTKNDGSDGASVCKDNTGRCDSPLIVQSDQHAKRRDSFSEEPVMPLVTDFDRLNISPKVKARFFVLKSLTLQDLLVSRYVYPYRGQGSFFPLSMQQRRPFYLLPMSSNWLTKLRSAAMALG